MTVEELEQLVKRGDVAALLDAMRPLSEAQRKTLAKTAANLYKAARQHERDYWAQLTTGRSSLTVTTTDMEQLHAPQAITALAVLGLCSWTEARKIGPDRRGFDSQQYVGRVLRDRKPEWADKWAQKELETAQWCDWATIREMVREGVCTRPASDHYISWMIRTGAGRYHHGDTLLLAFDRDPGLLQDEVWRIFEADFGDSVVLNPSDFDPEKSYHHGWGPFLISLADTGKLDRPRLLTASLDALNRRQHAQNASWFCKFHRALKPTAAEQQERQDKYANLLVNDVPIVVGLAIEMLREIAEAGQLKTGEIVDGLKAALALRQKGHALGATRLLKLCARQEGVRSHIAAAAAVGLEHPAVEVQEACLAILEQVGIDGAEEDVTTRATAVAASLQDRVRKLLGGQTPPVAHSREPEETAGLLAEAEGLPAPWRKLAGVDALLAAQSPGSELTAVTIDPTAVPRLDADNRLIPIASLDELIEGLSAAVEPDLGSQAGKVTEAEEIERLMDGLSRFADQRPDDFIARTAPLLKRVGDLLGDEARVFLPASIHRRFQFLVRAWIQRVQLPDINTGAKTSIADFFAARVMKLSRRFQSGVAGPLLACPTHKSGWIDPRTLVERLKYWLADGRKVEELDLIQALLRLAPDGRSHALKEAQHLPGEEGAALRFALGEPIAYDRKPGLVATASIALGGNSPIGKRRGLWIAAARARQPLGEIQPIVDAFGDVGPDGTIPARYTWRHRPRQGYFSSMPHELEVKAQQSSGSEESSVDLPTVLLHRRSPMIFAIGSILESRCIAQVWPLNPEPSFAVGALSINDRLDSPASSFSPTAQYLEPLLDQDVPLGPMARLALALSLLSKDAGTRGMAVDVLMTLITDGRCTGSEMTATFVDLARQKNVLRLNRLASALQEVSRAGPLHQHVVARMIQQLLARLPETPADLLHVLSPLRELLLGLGESLTPEVRVVLEKVKSGGKTGSTVKALLSIAPAQTPPKAVLIEALRGRLARAQKWLTRAPTWHLE